MDKILRINLTKGSIGFEDLDKNVAENFIGGSGLCAKILFDELKVGIDPLSPDNKLIFATGPVTGSKALFSGRHVVSAKSPLTRIYGQATSGGYFGAELKYSGIDAMIIEGRADHPVYISIKDDDVEIKDAKDFWGMDCFETEEGIKKDSEDKKTRVSCIGPAGENLVKFAAIMNEGGAAGRTGMGCVMGSKNLKAISVRGTGKVEVAKEDELNELSKEIRKQVKRNPIVKDFAENGTASGASASLNLLGALPTKYFTRGSFEGAVNLDGHTMTKTILKKRETCYNCPVACKRVVEITKGPYAGLSGRGPEYETCSVFGSLCLNDSLELVAKANDVCNRLGMDTLSAGNAIAFSMECYERGLVSKDGLGGIELEWGSESMLELLSDISSRKGFGDVLADGVRIAAGKIGAEEIAMHCKGLEIPMFDPRALKGMGLTYSTGMRGACHMMGMVALAEMGLGCSSLDLPKRLDPKSEEKKAKLVKIMQDWTTFMNSSVVCQLPLIRLGKGPVYTAKIFSMVTGVEIDIAKMVNVGEKIYDLQRLFNIREGISQKDDTLPRRFTHESHVEGPCKDSLVDLKPMLEEYYKLRGWEAGIPIREN